MQQYIFDTPEYLLLKKNESFEISFQKEGLRLTMYPTLNNQLLEIGSNATFGGLYFDGIMESHSFGLLLEEVFLWAESKSLGYRIKIPPQYLEPNIYQLVEFFFAKKNATITKEINQHLILNGDDYKHFFSKTNRKIVRQNVANGYHVTISNNLNVLGYELLQRNRMQRGINLSVSYENLLFQSEALLGRYVFFECWNSNQALAAYAVCIKIQWDVMYVFYWGEEPSERINSPVVLLAKFIIDYCNEQKIKFLDAGISTVHGVVDQGLYEFKSRLGFVPSEKYIIEGNYARYE